MKECFVIVKDLNIDVLINSVTSRQTGASWSYELVKDNSKEMIVRGTENDVLANIPVKELLIAMKIHSARLTDIRDIVAICDKLDNSKVIEFTKRGNLVLLGKLIKKIKKILDDKNFADSFKGVFSLEEVPVDNMNSCRNMAIKLENAISRK